MFRSMIGALVAAAMLMSAPAMALTKKEVEKRMLKSAEQYKKTAPPGTTFAGAKIQWTLGKNRQTQKATLVLSIKAVHNDPLHGPEKVRVPFASKTWTVKGIANTLKPVTATSWGRIYATPRGIGESLSVDQ